MFSTNDFLIFVFIKYITFIRGFIEPTWKLRLRIEKEEKRKNKKICGFNDIYIHQAVNVFHFTDDPNSIELDNLHNIT